MNKFSEFQICVQAVKPTFILTTETWTNNNISDNVLSIPNYSLFRCDRMGRKGGGVIVYVLNDIYGIPIHATRISDFPSGCSESVLLSISIVSYRFLLGCVYRPGGSREDDIQLFGSIARVANSSVPFLMFGDFNLPRINWTNLSAPHNDCPERVFLDHYLSSNLQQVITQPTRFCSSDQPSLLDLILENTPGFITATDLLPPIAKSDHIVIVATSQILINSATSIPKQNGRRCLWQADFNQINGVFDSVHWTASNDVEDLWSNLEQAISHSVNMYVPLRTTSRSQDKPWMNSFIRANIKKKRSLWDSYRKSHLSIDYSRYRAQANQLSTIIKDTRSKYQERIINSDSKNFYKYIKKHISSQVKPCCIRDPITSEISSDPHFLADVFANQFSSVFVKEPTDDLPIISDVFRTEQTLDTVNFSEDEVSLHLKSLPATSSPGLDGIHPLLLKNCTDTLTAPITKLMNTSMESGRLPSSWKEAVVIPIYKKGDRLSPANYRPISLTSHVCKIMEKIIVRKMTPFLLDNNVIPTQQHGFLPGRSTVSNLLLNLNAWTTEIDNGFPVDVVYLDFEKAFDRVPLRRLLHKLEHYGIRGNLLHWIEDFLKGRSFCVRINGVCSKPFEVLSGVPQGSVLGPLLFNIYISDLAQCIKSTVSFYADDTKFFTNPITHPTLIQEDLFRIDKWSRLWLLTLNATKCSVLHLGINNPRNPYFFMGMQLQQVEKQEDLGVLVTSDLKWNEHVSKIVKKTNSLVYLVKCVFKNLSPKSLTKIYVRYVRPLLEYASVVWCPYFVKDVDLLEKVQRRFTKLAPSLRDVPYSTRLEVLNLPTLSARRERGDMIEVYKVLHNHYSVALPIVSLSHNTHLRGHNYKLASGRFSKLARRHFFTNRVVNPWNSLPGDVVNSASINSFKNNYDSWFAQC